MYYILIDKVACFFCRMFLAALLLCLSIFWTFSPEGSHSHVHDVNIQIEGATHPAYDRVSQTSSNGGLRQRPSTKSTQSQEPNIDDLMSRLPSRVLGRCWYDLITPLPSRVLGRCWYDLITLLPSRVLGTVRGLKNYTLFANFWLNFRM